jgi:hypothetical protein
LWQTLTSIHFTTLPNCRPNREAEAIEPGIVHKESSVVDSLFLKMEISPLAITMLYFGTLCVCFLLISLQKHNVSISLKSVSVARWNFIFTYRSLLPAALTLFICWFLILTFWKSQAAQMGCRNNGVLVFLCKELGFVNSESSWIQSYALLIQSAGTWFWTNQRFLFLISVAIWMQVEAHKIGMPSYLVAAYYVIAVLGSVSASIILFMENIFRKKYLRRQESGGQKGPLLDLFPSPVLAISTISTLVFSTVLSETLNCGNRRLFSIFLALAFALPTLPMFLGSFRTNNQSPISVKFVRDIVGAVQGKVALAFFYILLVGFSMAIQVTNIAKYYSSSPNPSLMALFRVNFSNKLQLALAVDLFVSFAAVIFWIRRKDPLMGMRLGFITPVMSISTTFPLYLAAKQVQRAPEEPQKQL